MIATEQRTVDGRAFVRTYSDAGFLIERDGVKYSEAVDPAELAPGRVYTETDIPDLIPEPEPTDQEYATAGRILLGVTDNA